MDVKKRQRIHLTIRVFVGVLVLGWTFFAGTLWASEPLGRHMAEAEVSGNRMRLRHDLTVRAAFLSVKDAFNGGMVFNGPWVAVRYDLQWTVGRFDFSYCPELALGVPFSRGMAAVALQVVPVDIAFGAPVYQSDGHRLALGGEVTARYRYHIYPDLQNAHLFYFGEIGLAFRFCYDYRWEKGRIGLRWVNSLLGFTSRPDVNEPYFYALDADAFIGEPHRHLRFGSFDRYDRTFVQVEYELAGLGGHTFGLSVEYIGRFTDCRYQTLITGLIWRKRF